jgi:hypothetical protein
MAGLAGDLAAVVEHDGLDLRSPEVDSAALRHLGDRSA